MRGTIPIMENMDRLMEKRKLRAGRNDFPITTFQEKLKRAGLVFSYAERAVGKNQRKIHSESRRQCIISLVTALEVYLGDIALELMDIHGVEIMDKENIKKTLPEKYNILDVGVRATESLTGLGKNVDWGLGGGGFGIMGTNGILTSYTPLGRTGVAAVVELVRGCGWV